MTPAAADVRAASRWPEPRDAVLTAVVVLLSALPFATVDSTIGVRFADTPMPAADWRLALLVSAQAAPVLWMRTRPGVSLVAAGAAFLLAQLVGVAPTVASLVFPVSGYVAVVAGSRLGMAAYAATACAAVVAVQTMPSMAAASDAVSLTILAGCLFLPAPVVGAWSRHNRLRRTPVTGSPPVSAESATGRADPHPDARSSAGTGAIDGRVGGVPPPQRAPSGTAEHLTGWDQLTEREREVAALLAAGLSNAEIAAELRIGAETVKSHVRRILAKLGVRDRTQAAILIHTTRSPR